MDAICPDFHRQLHVVIDDEGYAGGAQKIAKGEDFCQHGGAVCLPAAVLHDADPAGYGAAHGFQQAVTAALRRIGHEVEVQIKGLAHANRLVE